MGDKLIIIKCYFWTPSIAHLQIFLINFRNTKIEQQVTIDLQTCQADFEKMAELRKVIGEFILYFIHIKVVHDFLCDIL